MPALESLHPHILNRRLLEGRWAGVVEHTDTGHEGRLPIRQSLPLGRRGWRFIRSGQRHLCLPDRRQGAGAGRRA